MGQQRELGGECSVPSLCGPTRQRNAVFDRVLPPPLGAVLSEATGQSLLSLSRERLGQPLGFEVPSWVRDPQGRYLGGNEMALTLDGMVRFGELYVVVELLTVNKFSAAIGWHGHLRRRHALCGPAWAMDMAGSLAVRLVWTMRWPGLRRTNHLAPRSGCDAISSDPTRPAQVVISVICRA